MFKLPEPLLLPLYRQSQIFARDGLDLDRSTLADWVGRSTALLEPLAEAIGRHVLEAGAIFADDAPVWMLAPGTGKTQTARLWAYARDERPWGGDARPAAWYRFSGDRKGQHPRDHLAIFLGRLVHVALLRGKASMTERARVVLAIALPWLFVPTTANLGRVFDLFRPFIQ